MNEDVLGQPAREALAETTRRCTATNRAGERCGRAPIVGGFVCVLHGGAVPAVRKSARERLLAMVDPALDALLRFLRTAPPCDKCGRSDADRDPVVLRAAQLVLDRTGFHPGIDLHVQASAPPFEKYLPWLPEERLEQMRAWLQEAKAVMEAGDPTAMHLDVPGPDTWDVDGVLVEAESDPGDEP